MTTPAHEYLPDEPQALVDQLSGWGDVNALGLWVMPGWADHRVDCQLDPDSGRLFLRLSHSAARKVRRSLQEQMAKQGLSHRR